MLYALIVILQVDHPATPGCMTWDADPKKARVVECPAFTTAELQKPSKAFRTEAACEKALSALKLPGHWSTAECVQIKPP